MTAAGKRRGRHDADVVVVGGGHNGLVCAAYLARAGLEVEVLEQAATPGGAIVGDDRTADGGARLELGAVEHTTILGSSVLDDLALADHGLRYRRRRVAGLHLFGDGRHVTIAGTAEATAESIAALDPHDADAWLELTRLAATMGRALGALSSGIVPSASTVRAMGRLALGRRGADVVDLASCSALDLAERWFRSDHLHAVVVARAQVAGLPPWYPGTGAVFCFTPSGHGRDLGRPVGGGPAFVRALVAAVTAAGGRVRTGARVSGLAPDGDGWAVTVEGGGRLRARAVVAAVPHHTVLRLLPADVVPDRLRESFARATVVGGNVSQATVAAHLGARPPVPHAPDDDHAGAMLWLAPRPADCLDGYAAAFAGALPARPTLAFTFPSVLDPTAAPPGEATVWADAFVAHRLQTAGDGHGRDTSWAEAAPTLAARVWDTAAACLGTPVAPLVRRQVVTTPADLTARTGAENPGNHLAPTLEQSLGWRPVRALGGHRTPWPGGLYLSGAGTHPGGSVSGEPGRLAARAVLADLTATRAQRLRAGGADAWGQLIRTLGAVRAGRAGRPGA